MRGVAVRNRRWTYFFGREANAKLGGTTEGGAKKEEAARGAKQPKIR